MAKTPLHPIAAPGEKDDVVAKLEEALALLEGKEQSFKKKLTKGSIELAIKCREADIADDDSSAEPPVEPGTEPLVVTPQ